MKFEPVIEHADLGRVKLLLIAVAALLVAAGAMVLAHRLPASRGLIGDPGMFPHRGTITSLATLASEHDAAYLEGQQVLLADVRVDAVLGERALLIGIPGHAVPVIGFGRLPSAALARGARVRIHGIVRLAPNPAEVAEREALALREAAAVRGHALYISALEVVPLPIIAREAPPRVITSLDQLAQFDPEALQARHVVLDRVRVLRVLGDYTFLVGDPRAPVPVVVLGELTGRQPEGQTEIDTGDEVRIYGVVQRLRTVEEIEPSLTTEEATELRTHAVFIGAQRIVELEPGT